MVLRRMGARAVGPGIATQEDGKGRTGARVPAPDWVVCIDGASRGNPGQAAIGVVLLRSGRPVREIGEAIGVATNNVAEYRALLRGLREAEMLGARAIRVHSDSELLVRQLTGRYRVEIARVPRERNAAADALANRALDDAGARG